MSAQQPSDSAQEMDPAKIDEKRKRMLERLNARHIQHSTIPADVSQEDPAVLGPKELDHLYQEAKTILESSKPIDPAFLERLETALSLLPAGFESRRLRELHGQLRAKLQQESLQASVFSFSSRHKPVKPTASPSHQQKSVAAKDAVAGIVRSKDAKTVSDLVNETLDIEGLAGEDIVVSDVTGCRIVVKFSASTVHLKHVVASTLVLAPVQSSVLIRDCSDVTLVAAAQQIRIHNSQNLRLHVAVRGAVIIEDCTEVEVAPYRISGLELDWSNDNWKEVKDFNWLAEREHSPNWRIMDEDAWVEFEL